MKRLLVLLLIGFAAWYGWKHYPELLEKRGGHEAVIENSSGMTMERIRLRVDGQTLVRESLADGEKGVLPFKVNNDSEFELEWEYGQKLGTHQWKGGMVPRGPMLQRHIFTVDQESAVMYRAENK